MRNKVVIGANYGDEGKGLMTDYFVSKFNSQCFVVRFNGGAQAGHTVVTPEGLRHKFSHFGSGTLLRAPTYLSRFFIVNPLLFMREFSEFNLPPQVFVDAECLISTPYDMYLNQMRENSRGDNKHGSCGMGINETIERSYQKEFCDNFCLTASDLRDDSIWVDKLDRIARKYFASELEKLGKPDPLFDHTKFFQIFKEFKKRVIICDLDVLQDHDVVFEGAQGLLLDQNHPNFPHVTRSNTGFQNVKELLYEAGREGDDTEVVYATRSYMTRHGRGPFPTEIEGLPYKNVVDDTNLILGRNN